MRKDGIMKNIFIILTLALGLSGCATKMAYLNTQKTGEEIKSDTAACEAAVNSSDFKNPALKENKINQCMQEKGYKVVSEEEAEKIQGFRELWVKPGIDLKAYEVAFIDKVDLSRLRAGSAQKIADEDIDTLGKEMLGRFVKALDSVVPVVTDKEKAAGKKALHISLKLNSAAATDIGMSAAFEAVGQMSSIPLPGAPEKMFSFEGAITDLSGEEKLITFTDEAKSDKNASFMGMENFERWKHACNIMDYWADHLAALVAKERGQEYKSRLGFKLIDF